MNIDLSTKMLDIIMPYCRKYKLTPAKAILLILEQHAAMDANNDSTVRN